MKDKTLIMIVDDDPNIAQLVKLYLEKDGYDTVAYGRGDEALAAFRQNPAQPDDPGYHAARAWTAGRCAAPCGRFRRFPSSC